MRGQSGRLRADDPRAGDARPVARPAAEPAAEGKFYTEGFTLSVLLSVAAQKPGGLCGENARYEILFVTPADARSTLTGWKARSAAVEAAAISEPRVRARP